MLVINVKDDEFLKNIEEYKLSSDLINNYIVDVIFETSKFKCVGCCNDKEDHRRFICVSCRKGPYRTSIDNVDVGHCDFCEECYNKLCNGDYLKDGRFVDAVCREGIDVKNSLFLRCEYNTGNYGCI